MPKPLVLGLCAILYVACSAAPVKAQDTVLMELYGQGVHAFFSGHDFHAIEIFNQALAAGSRDPRVYFFRGLAAERLGRIHEAEGDFQAGAELEVSGGDRVYPINRSLERIQGYQRLMLEKYRLQARLDARLRSQRASGARYEDLQRAEGEVLRTPTPTPTRPAPTTPAPTTPPRTTTPPPMDPTDPFSTDPMPQPTPSTPGTGTPPADTETNPFADDPFGAPATPPATPPATTPPGGGADPFGADPFGGGAAPPADNPPAGGGADPFGADPFGGGAAPPAGNPPAGGAADPFGGGADPFGT